MHQSANEVHQFIKVTHPASCMMGLLHLMAALIANYSHLIMKLMPSTCFAESLDSADVVGV